MWFDSLRQLETLHTGPVIDKNQDVVQWQHGIETLIWKSNQELPYSCQTRKLDLLSIYSKLQQIHPVACLSQKSLHEMVFHM